MVKKSLFLYLTVFLLAATVLAGCSSSEPDGGTGTDDSSYGW